MVVSIITEAMGTILKKYKKEPGDDRCKVNPRTHTEESDAGNSTLS